MISKDSINKLATEYQTAEFPNIVREYFQHLFLSRLYKLVGAENLLFKGGTALRIVYGSPRFSEDLDFSLIKIPDYQRKEYVENLFINVLLEIEKVGIKVEISKKSNVTSGGYFGDAEFSFYDYPPIGVTINISERTEKDTHGEIDTIANDFIPAYNLIHLSKEELVEEKVFGALLGRKKPRDFYDLYFLMRKGLLTLGQKKRLAEFKNNILEKAKEMDFYNKLSAFLPESHQSILKSFNQVLKNELERQLAST